MDKTLHEKNIIKWEKNLPNARLQLNVSVNMSSNHDWVKWITKSILKQETSTFLSKH